MLYNLFIFFNRNMYVDLNYEFFKDFEFSQFYPFFLLFFSIMLILSTFAVLERWLKEINTIWNTDNDLFAKHICVALIWVVIGISTISGSKVINLKKFQNLKNFYLVRGCTRKIDWDVQSCTRKSSWGVCQGVRVRLHASYWQPCVNRVKGGI